MLRFGLALFFGLAALSVHAGERIVLVTGEWPPYVSARLPGEGVFTQMVRAAFRRAGYEVTLRYVSWPMAEAMVEHGEAMAAFPYKPTEERMSRFRFSRAVMRSSSYFYYYRPNGKITFRRFAALEALKALRIGCPRGYWFDSLLSRHGIRLLYTPDEETALRLLQMGQLDLVPIDSENATYLIRREGLGRTEDYGWIEPALTDRASTNLMFTRALPRAAAVMADFDRAIGQMERDGSLQAIHDGFYTSLSAVFPH